MRPTNARAAALALVALLAGCASSSPTTRHHSLLPPAQPGAVAAPAPVLRYDVGVAVPAQVDRPQFVIRLADDTLMVLEQDRWIAPLGDELRGAIELRIGRVLATAPAAPQPDGRWWVGVEVQRFDSLWGREAAVQVQWSLRGGRSEAALRCQAALSEPVRESSAAALAAAHRTIAVRLGDAIGRSLQAAASGAAGGCG